MTTEPVRVLNLFTIMNRGGAEKISQNEAEYEKLWKGFFESISIKERENPHLQRTTLPVRYRREMPEFY